MLKLLPVFIFIIPGMIAFALAKSGQNAMLQQTFFDANGELIRDNAQQAFPMLVAQVLPVGVRGIVVAGLLAALMSSLAGAFNVSSALFTMDFYSKFKPEATQKQLVWIGRVATARHGAHRSGLDPGHPGRQGPLRLPAGGAGLPGPADLRGLLPGRLREAAERARGRSGR